MSHSAPPAHKRVLRRAEVVRTERLTPDLARVHFRGSDLTELPDSPHTDRYIKILFAPPRAPYSWPFDPAEIREEYPRELWPVTRTYTIRHLDSEVGEMAIDFVIHGDEGLAGPWAANAQPGDSIGFFGPGSGWGPDAKARWHLLIGDESAAPAIAATMDALPLQAQVLVFIEVTNAGAHVPLRSMPNALVNWVYREDWGGDFGRGIVAAVRATPLPEGRIAAFAHGSADMIKALRRFLLVEQGLPKQDVSISGYWRTGINEDAWQASKHAFVAAMEDEERSASACQERERSDS